MALYNAILTASAFRETSLILDDYGRNVEVELLVKDDVIYLFDSESKALLRELLIFREFSVNAGAAPQTVVLRDQTKEVVLQAACEDTKQNCIDGLQRLADAGLPEANGDQFFHAEPAAVVFRHPESPPFTNIHPASAMMKSSPPPLAPKPTRSTKSFHGPHAGATTSNFKNLVPHGTVRAISRGLEKVLFTNSFSASSFWKPNQYTIEKKKPEEGQKLLEDTHDQYESMTRLCCFTPPLSRSKLSRVPSDPGMHEDTSGTSPVLETKVQLPLAAKVDDHDFDSDWEESYEVHDRTTVRFDDEPAINGSKITQDDPDTYASNVEISRPWLMFGHPTREEAVKLIKGKQDGFFVVRNRDGRDAEVYPYALTVLYKDKPIHIQIQRTQDSGLAPAPWRAGEKAFETLDDLVQYYRDNRLGFSYKNTQGYVSLHKDNFGHD